MPVIEKDFSPCAIMDEQTTNNDNSDRSSTPNEADAPVTKELVTERNQLKDGNQREKPLSEQISGMNRQIGISLSSS